MLEWNSLTQSDDMDQLIRESDEYPLLIFKHSTRCNVSSIAKMRLEAQWDEAPNLKPYLLDIFKNRDVSDAMVDVFGIEHESPQALILHKGVCVYHTSHLDISVESILRMASSYLAVS